jgi:hypothetical protein
MRHRRREPRTAIGPQPLRVGPKGFEPLPAGLKVRRAAVTPRPRMQVGRMRFHRVRFMVTVLLVSCALSSVVALRVELSATRLSAESGRPALDYRSAARTVVGTRRVPLFSCSLLDR